MAIHARDYNRKFLKHEKLPSESALIGRLNLSKSPTKNGTETPTYADCVREQTRLSALNDQDKRTKQSRKDRDKRERAGNSWLWPPDAAEGGTDYEQQQRRRGVPSGARTDARDPGHNMARGYGPIHRLAEPPLCRSVSR